MKSIIVIGDVHGCYKTLLKLIEQLPKDVPICFTGDLIDRGSHSMEVVDFVIKNNYKVCMGNHEQMMILAQMRMFEWNNNGGIQTMRSYGDNLEKFRAHREWMENLPTYLEFKDIINDKGQHLLVSHSNAAPVWNKSLPRETFEDTILWGRGGKTGIEGIYNVFGHTPFELPQVTENCTMIDTGCVFGGNLSAIQFPEIIIYAQKNIEEDI